MDLAFQSDTFMATTHGSARWASPEETLSAGLLAEEGSGARGVIGRSAAQRQRADPYCLPVSSLNALIWPRISAAASRARRSLARALSITMAAF